LAGIPDGIGSGVKNFSKTLCAKPILAPRCSENLFRIQDKPRDFWKHYGAKHMLAPLFLEKAQDLSQPYGANMTFSPLAGGKSQGWAAGRGAKLTFSPRFS
jgi:hypothetical protein